MEMEFLNMAQILTQNAQCTLMGSLCLSIQCPDILERSPSDADFFAEPSLENILKIIFALQNNGYEVFSWQDKIDENFDFTTLKGRFYIRGIRNSKNIDITYEIDSLNYNEMRIYETVINNIRMYDISGLIMLLSKSDKEKNRKQLTLLQNKLT